MTNFSTTTRCNFQPIRFYDSRSATQRAAVAVSACLAGEKVRYDGADQKLSHHQLLHRELNLIAICPELGAGLGVPRPPIQLVETDNKVLARGKENRMLNVTTALETYAALSLQQLSSNHLLCGYLLKSRSPSCGFGSTPLFNPEGVEIKRRSGIQADYFRSHLPHLNYCEETAIETESAAMSFILRSRIVFDLLHASTTPLQTLHYHYAFLHTNFTEQITQQLHDCSKAEKKTDYLVALLAGCNQIPEDNLLKLFREEK